MDWNRAIERNSEALRKIVTALFAMLAAAALAAPARPPLSLGEGASTAFTLPRHLHAAILLILRPAESAVRRLIFILAFTRNSAMAGPACPTPSAADANQSARLPDFSTLFPTCNSSVFALFDPLKSFDPAAIWNISEAAQARFESGFDLVRHPSSGFAILPDGDEPIAAAAILQRLAALRRALDTLPAQARRLIRWQARRGAALHPLTPRRERSRPRRAMRVTPFRPGLPPGWRQRPTHEIDGILKECHRLAMDLMNEPGTG